MTTKDVLRKYTRLIAHLIAHSLGYFSVLSAASAVLCYINNEPCFCEWYSHMAGFKKEGTYEERLIEINKTALELSFLCRRSHNGYMASYAHAIALVKAELNQAGRTADMLASWF